MVTAFKDAEVLGQLRLCGPCLRALPATPGRPWVWPQNLLKQHGPSPSPAKPAAQPPSSSPNSPGRRDPARRTAPEQGKGDHHDQNTDLEPGQEGALVGEEGLGLHARPHQRRGARAGPACGTCSGSVLGARLSSAGTSPCSMLCLLYWQPHGGTAWDAAGSQPTGHAIQHDCNELSSAALLPRSQPACHAMQHDCSQSVLHCPRRCPPFLVCSARPALQPVPAPSPPPPAGLARRMEPYSWATNALAAAGAAPAPAPAPAPARCCSPSLPPPPPASSSTLALPDSMSLALSSRGALPQPAR